MTSDNLNAVAKPDGVKVPKVGFVSLGCP